jgi:hypothetical protein
MTEAFSGLTVIMHALSGFCFGIGQSRRTYAININCTKACTIFSVLRTAVKTLLSAQKNRNEAVKDCLALVKAQVLLSHRYGTVTTGSNFCKTVGIEGRMKKLMQL